MIPDVVTAGDTIQDLLARWPSAAVVFVRRGMHCVGCSISAFDTIGDACATYGIDADDLIGEINRQLPPEIVPPIDGA